ncbi:hypothetical protein P20495_0806 [Pseudoalteromonas sp. BSi20495]|nr:hypothetical protein P20495_0806 [Pseudoalteromonas sp. BSi20495]
MKIESRLYENKTTEHIEIISHFRNEVFNRHKKAKQIQLGYLYKN